MPQDNLTRAEAQARARVVSNVDYRIDLELSDDPTRATYRSTTRLTFDAKPGASTFLNLQAESAHVWLNGRRLPDSAFANNRIELDGLKAHNEVVVVANARYESTGVGMHRLVDPADSQTYLYTHCEPYDAHRVYACFDQPDLKAKFQISVTAPAKWSVISNGAETAATLLKSGHIRHDFAQTKLMSTYLAAVVAGPYHRIASRHNGVDMSLYCRKSMAPYLEKDEAEIFEITRQGLDFYADYFQIAYPFGKYDQLFVPEFNMGAMEQPGCVTFNESYLFRSRVTPKARARRAEVILHEMAHMWFGNLVTMKWWGDLWLNESFATFMSAVAQHAATNFKDSWLYFADRIKSWALEQDQMPTTHPIVADCPDTNTARQNFDGISYAKGASSLRQLEAVIGATAFRDGLRTYMRTFSWSNASLSDFLAAVGRGSKRNLAQWSREWLETTGPSVLSADVVFSGGRIASLAVKQSSLPQHPTLRSHRLAIGLYAIDSAGVLRRTDLVEVDVAGAHTQLDALRGKRADLVLVNDSDLTYAKVRLDARSLAVAKTHISTVEDPLARRLLWSAAWEMVRDAEMAASEYVGMVARHVSAESDADTVDSLLGTALGGLRFCTPSNRAALQQRVAQVAHQGMITAAAGSDLQLVYAKSYFATANEPLDIERFVRLLDGRDTINGITLDVSMRWSLISRLVAKGRFGDAEVQAELARDNTDFGRRNAQTALTSMPTAAAKQAAWTQLTTPGALNLASMRAVIGGFYAGSEQLTAPYAALYEQSVAAWWAQLQPDVAATLTSGLFPPLRQNLDSIAIADRLLARNDLPAQAQRILLERRDAAARQRAARTLDAAFSLGQGGSGQIAV